MITIPKKEISRLEATIKEKDLIIAEHLKTIEKQKLALDIGEGLLIYNNVLAQQIQLLYWGVVKEMEALTSRPVVIQGKCDNTNKMIEDLEGKILKGKNAWGKFLQEHETAKSFLIGRYHITIPAMPVVQ